MTDLARRRFFQLAAGAVAGGALLNPLNKSIAGICIGTPPQTAGPFYPGATRFKNRTDLTTNPTNGAQAIGQVVIVAGRVINESCQPLENVDVEIWQACASGRYNHQRDPNPAALDPNFQYWGETLTNEKGEFAFKTIIPGAYPADSTWTRPPHIHFKVSRLGYRELVTQMYFKGSVLNQTDVIFRGLSPSEQAAVTIDFKPDPNFEESGGHPVGKFEITLVPVRRS